MDDSVLALLPHEIAAEAQALRIDRVLRHRQLMQERLLRETGMLGAILQNSGAFWGGGLFFPRFRQSLHGLAQPGRPGPVPFQTSRPA